MPETNNTYVDFTTAMGGAGGFVYEDVLRAARTQGVRGAHIPDIPEYVANTELARQPDRERRRSVRGITVGSKDVINWPTTQQIIQFAKEQKIPRRQVRICKNCGGLSKSSKCDSCATGKSSISWIKEWNAKPTPRFYGKADHYYGMELEVININKRRINGKVENGRTDKGNDRGKHFLAATMSKLHRREFYAKHDGSVELEIVSHPMSYDYIMSNWKETFGTMTKIFSKMGCRSWKYYSVDETKEGKCGAHIHVSSTIGKLIILKIVNFFLAENNWHFLQAVSGRKTIDNHYCSFPRMQQYYHGKALYWVENRNGHDNRYMPLNLESQHTVEFRLFRGSLNQDRLMFYFQFVESFIEWLKTEPDPDAAGIIDLSAVKYIEYIQANANRWDVVDFFFANDLRIHNTIKDSYNVHYNTQLAEGDNKRPPLQLLDD